jgi:hypothetical protein
MYAPIVTLTLPHVDNIIPFAIVVATRIFAYVHVPWHGLEYTRIQSHEIIRYLHIHGYA